MGPGLGADGGPGDPEEPQYRQRRRSRPRAELSLHGLRLHLGQEPRDGLRAVGPATLPIPTDHALLIAERLALALAAAHESRLQDERLLHGFLVPQLVMISNEGETRLLGFEVAPGLRDLAAGGWQEDALRPYLPPEALSGMPTAKSDDVYSLGAILFELLTGERLPVVAAEGYAAVYAGTIDAAQLPNEGTPLPAPVAALLKKSLAPREQRIADAVTWHKTLSKLMIDSNFSPTTFNLAFFMHSLFRDEIERENQEIQAEKRLELPKRPAASVPVAVAAPAAAAQDPREATGVSGVREAAWPGTHAQSAQAAEPSKKPLWIGLAAAAVVALAAGGYFMFGRSGDAAVPPPAPYTPPPPRPRRCREACRPRRPRRWARRGRPPQPEELQAQIQKMFEARSKEMEDKLKGQYDDRIKQLQQQLQESKKPEPAKAERIADKIEPAPAPVETRTVPKPEPASPPQVTPPQLGAAAVPAPAGEKPAASPAPASSAPAQAAVPRPQTQAQMGDLVQPGTGVAAPKLAWTFDPRYPPAAKHLSRAAQVDIKVLVDEHGKVLDADRIGGKAGFGFDKAAIDAARRAVFQPATKDGVRVKMWTTLRVNFQADVGRTLTPQPLSPDPGEGGFERSQANFSLFSRVGRRGPG